MPEIGETKRGSELGSLNNRLHVWHACVDCGKERWVYIVKGQPVNTRCRICGTRDGVSRAKVSASLLRISTRPPATVRPDGELPQIGDLQYGNALGYKINSPYVRIACAECGIQLWVPLYKDGPHSTHCRSCIGKSPKRLNTFISTLIKKGPRGYPAPKGTPEAPIIGDIRTGQELGRNNWVRYMWQSCETCGRARWATTYQGKVAWTQCRLCAAKDPKNRELLSANRMRGKGIIHPTAKGDPLNPQVGDIQRGTSFGLQYSGWYIRQSCADCGKERWVSLYHGTPLAIRCGSCARKNPERISKSTSTRAANNRPQYGQRTEVGPYFGIRLSPDDDYYPMVNAHGIVLEHRLVMARHMGRCLLPDPFEIVHHKFGNKRDNRIEMLELSSGGQHIKDHSKGYIDGYEKGYMDGDNARVKDLETELKKWNPTSSLLTNPEQLARLQSKEVPNETSCSEA